MQAPGREPSMEDILASIKKVIAEDKELRAAATAGGRSPSRRAIDAEDDVLELNEELAPPADLGPPLLDQTAPTPAAAHWSSCSTSSAAGRPRLPQVNPLEEMVREMLRPMLKQWLDEHLPGIVDEHVRREISRITGRPL